MLTQDQIQQAANDLYNAEMSRQQIDPITLSHPKLTMADAYAIQTAGIKKKIQQGRHIIGYKIGLTSRTMQRAMHIETPDYGVLLDDMLFESNSPITTQDFLDPRIEAELAFVLKDRLYGDKVSIFDVLNATDYVIPALELIAARSYRVHPDSGYTRTVCDTIADNAANAGIIMGGRPIRPDECDLRWCGVVLHVNEIIEQTGLAAGVLNHPANGVCWLANYLAPHDISLEPGQVILSGSFTGAIKVTAGDTVYADYGKLGSIPVTFS